MKSHRLSSLLLIGLFVVSAQVDRPNLLVILFDDLDYSDLGCYGGEIDTPNIDSIAQDGVWNIGSDISFASYHHG
jgi:hypothetical protein